MQTRDKIEEARDILTAMLASKRGPATIVRAHRLLESALADFFSDVGDTAALTDDPGDEIVGDLGPFIDP